jgi:hypothetical protein
VTWVLGAGIAMRTSVGGGGGDEGDGAWLMPNAPAIWAADWLCWFCIGIGGAESRICVVTDFEGWKEALLMSLAKITAPSSFGVNGDFGVSWTVGAGFPHALSSFGCFPVVGIFAASVCFLFFLVNQPRNFRIVEICLLKRYSLVSRFSADNDFDTV